jgi:hypothetical protein
MDMSAAANHAHLNALTSQLVASQAEVRSLRAALQTEQARHRLPPHVTAGGVQAEPTAFESPPGEPIQVEEDLRRLAHILAERRAALEQDAVAGAYVRLPLDPLRRLLSKLADLKGDAELRERHLSAALAAEQRRVQRLTTDVEALRHERASTVALAGEVGLLQVFCTALHRQRYRATPCRPVLTLSEVVCGRLWPPLQRCEMR